MCHAYSTFRTIPVKTIIRDYLQRELMHERTPFR